MILTHVIGTGYIEQVEVMDMVIHLLQFRYSI